MKKLVLVIALFTLVFTLAACGEEDAEPKDKVLECPAGQIVEGDVCVDEPLVCPTGEHEEAGACVIDELQCDAPLVPVDGECLIPYTELDTDVTGRVDLMLWSGSGEYWADLGHQDLTVEELTAQNDAASYYVAKAFNELYPNVVINVRAHAGGTENWQQKLIDYKNDHGVHPSVWASTDLAGDVSKGIVADLSQFDNDPVYRSMNPSILNMMNYQGFQAGLPQYILPWGIYVNKELAYYKNLDVPAPDWTIDEYTDFIGNHEEDVYYGSMDTPIRLLETGSNYIAKGLFEYSGSGDFVDLNNDEVRSLIPYLVEWNEHAMWGNTPSQEFFDANSGGWGYGWFKNGALLTLEGDPWMMGDCATTDPEWWGHCTSTDWDIYPRPSTDFVDNTVGIVLDPMAVYNFCLNDDNLGCTEQELLDIKISYTFASFWIASNESWTARAQGEFYDVGSAGNSSALNDSFPVTKGDLFTQQMQLWYTPAKHQRFSNPEDMPGFHEVIRIYEEGQFWDISDKSFPYFHDSDGTRRENLYEWKNYYNPDINGGVEKTDPAFVDTILNNLFQWNVDSNLRFAQSYADLKNGLITYYGYTESDFN